MNPRVVPCVRAGTARRRFAAAVVLLAVAASIAGCQGGSSSPYAGEVEPTLPRVGPADSRLYPDLASMPERPRDLPTAADVAARRDALEAARASAASVPPSAISEQPLSAETASAAPLVPPAPPGALVTLKIPPIAPDVDGPAAAVPSVDVASTQSAPPPPPEPVTVRRAPPAPSVVGSVPSEGASIAAAAGGPLSPPLEPVTARRAPPAPSFEPPPARVSAQVATFYLADGTTALSEGDIAVLGRVAAELLATDGRLRIIGYRGRPGAADADSWRERASVLVAALADLGVGPSQVSVESADGTLLDAEESAAGRTEIYLDY